MNKMKQAYLMIAILTFGLNSCQTNNSTETQNQDFSEQILNQIKSLQDTVLTSKSMDKNEFQANLSEVSVNTKLTSKLDGEWTTQNGKIKFLNTLLETGDKVIFYDTIRSSMTGWGTIKYNRAANFYFTESGSNMYEYYVLDNDKLVLTQYDYRNDDLSIKVKPEAILQEINIEFNTDDQIKLILKGQIVELKRGNTTANTQ